MSAHVDVLVVGGTKGGMPPSEALVVFDRRLASRLDARLKQEYGDGTPEIRALTPEMRREIQERLEWA